MSWQSPGIEIPFTNGFYRSRSLHFSAQRCINYRANMADVPALSLENLYQTEGVEQILSALSDSPCRGSHTMNGKAYYVIGDRLWRIDRTVNPDLSETFSSTNLGEILGSGDVIMVSGWSGTGYEMAIVSPSQHAYSYREATGSVADISGLSNFLSPVEDVVNINGFFVFLQTGTNTVFHSNLNDISTYNALDSETITASPLVVGLMRYRSQLYVMGDSVTIPYVFIGGSNFVFQAQPNAVIPSGLNNVTAKTNIRTSFCYLGGGETESPAIWLSQGGNPVKISSEAIDYEIRGKSLLDSSRLFSFSIDGGEYIAFQVNDDCFVYDILSGRWHERRSSVGDSDVKWRVNTVTRCYGRLMVGDAIDGRIGALDNIDTEYGENIHRSFTLQPFDNKGKAIRVQSILVAMDAGFGGEMVLDWSDDGGHTWSNGRRADAGASGEYGRHVRWDSLGAASFSRVLRFGTSSAVKCNVNKILAIA